MKIVLFVQKDEINFSIKHQAWDGGDELSIVSKISKQYNVNNCYIILHTNSCDTVIIWTEEV